MTQALTPRELVAAYLANNFRIVVWPAEGDAKGPTAKGWTTRAYTLDDYHEPTATSTGDRVGVMTGHEISPGHFLHDVDIDWAAGSTIAQVFLPTTRFVYGRHTKRISHCFYTLPEALPSFKYEDIDGSTLIELRGAKRDGDVGLQSMVPPSIWTKAGQSEPLVFVTYGLPAHVESASALKQRVCLAAIAMLCAKHFGPNGFGHEPRLAWAGFFLRAGITVADLQLMGEAISVYCQNREIQDVRRVLESTAVSLSTEGKRVKGGPSLAKIFGEHGKKILARINEWIGRDSDFLRDRSGLILRESQENIRRAITLLDEEFTYNMFSGKMLQGKEPLEDVKVEGLWLRVDREFRFRPSRQLFDAVVRDVAWEHRFHPVKDYLKTLVWDGTPRIATWIIECAGADDTPYIRAVSAIFLIAAVRRVMSPGCKYDELLVLESRVQGLNKSSAISALCPDPSWFSDDLPLNVDGQRVIEATQGKWIIEAAELVGRRADREHIKAMLSRQVDHARMAYARNAVSVPREWVAIGTTNSDEYLSDPSGSRRFWPVFIRRFNIEQLLAMRDQLWAEAAVQEAAGASIRLPEELWPVAGEEQKKRHESHAFEDVIRDAVLREPAIHGRRRILSEVLWNSLGIELKDRPRLYKSVHEVMTRFGYKKTTIRVPGENVPRSGFIAIEIGDAAMTAPPEEVVEREPGDEDEPVRVVPSDDAPF